MLHLLIRVLLTLVKRLFDKFHNTFFVDIGDYKRCTEVN